MSVAPKQDAVRLVTCPGCGGKSRYATDNPFRPFCSEPCKNHDFGAWATESYRVAAKPQDDDDPAVDADETH